MKHFAHAADRIVNEAFAPFFSEKLPPYLGQEVFLAIGRRLRIAGRYLDDEHADEVFQRVVVEAYSYLARYGGHQVRHVSEWLHRITLNTTRRYLLERSYFDSPSTSSLNTIADGEIQSSGGSTDVLFERVHEAIHNLKPRYQEVVLDLLEGLPSPEIQKRMKTGSNAYFRKLKCDATKALREELSRFFRPNVL